MRFAPVALTACVASEARRLFTAANQERLNEFTRTLQLNGPNGKGANIHCMDILDPMHTGAHAATFRRGASQAGCTIQLTNDRMTAIKV